MHTFLYFFFKSRGYGKQVLLAIEGFLSLVAVDKEARLLLAGWSISHTREGARVCVCVCVRERERERESERERERVCVCVCVRVRGRACESERVCVCACV
jgi:hypothetical protein